MLRSSSEFVRYAVNVAVQKIQQLEESGHTDGPDGQNPDRIFRFLCDMTRLESLCPFLLSGTECIINLLTTMLLVHNYLRLF